MVLEVFWARGVWGYREEMKLGSASWGGSKAGRIHSLCLALSVSWAGPVLLVATFIEQ